MRRYRLIRLISSASCVTHKAIPRLLHLLMQTTAVVMRGVPNVTARDTDPSRGLYLVLKIEELVICTGTAFIDEHLDICRHLSKYKRRV